MEQKAGSTMNNELKKAFNRIPIVGRKNLLDVQITVRADGQTDIRNLSKDPVANLFLAQVFTQLATNAINQHMQATAKKVAEGVPIVEKDERKN